MNLRDQLQDILSSAVTFETDEQRSEALVKDIEAMSSMLCHLVEKWAPDLDSTNLHLTASQFDRIQAAAARLHGLNSILGIWQ